MKSKVPLLAAVLLLVLALATGFRPLYLLLYVAAGLALLGYAWAWLMARSLEVSIQTLSAHPEVGKPTSFRAVAHERAGIPRTGIRAQVVLNFADTAQEALSIPAHGRVSWDVLSVCQRRGLHTVGSVRITAQDPFGLASVTREIGETREIVVYPATVPIASPAPRGNTGLEGGSYGAADAGPRHMHTAAATVREYQTGDRISSIHWPSTARMGTLMAKQFQRVEAAEIWLMLDFQGDVQAGAGASGTEERIVTIAASLAKHFASGGQSVGLAFQGAAPCSMTPQRGRRHLEDMLHILAIARAEGRLPMDSLMSQHSNRFSPGSLIIAVQPTSGSNVGKVANVLRRRGVAVMKVLLDTDGLEARTPRRAGRTLDPDTAAAGGWSRVIRQGDDLSVQLGGLLASLTS